MSFYHAIRFRGIIKPQFRSAFAPIALEGKWREASNEVLRDFGEENRVPGYIPCGASHMIRRWQEDPWKRSWVPETGEWIFQCDVNQRSFDIAGFKEEIIPYICESVEHYETACESEEPGDEDNTVLFQLIDGELEIAGSYDSCGNFKSIEEIRKEKGLL